MPEALGKAIIHFCNNFFFHFSNAVLGISSGIHEIGGVRMELFAYLVLAWVIVYLVIWKGLHNSGKVKVIFDLFSFHICATIKTALNVQKPFYLFTHLE